VEHAGVLLGPFGVCGYANRATLEGHDYLGSNRMIANYSAVMGYGMMTRRSVFESMGGFDEELAGAYSDVDYCLRLREKGFLITYTPYSVMTHHIPVHPEEAMVVEPEATIFRKRWRALIDEDPFFNPNFSRMLENFVPATPMSGRFSKPIANETN
jgi:GT2 family glycosyltransferase